MGSKPKNAIYLIGFSREKTALENPQIFQSCKYKNNNSAIHSQSERVGHFNGQLLHNDALAGHFSRHGQTDIRQHGGSDICQTAALAQLHIAAAKIGRAHV